MPLTKFQKEILALIAKNRCIDSHIAGGLVLNAGDDALRFSHNVDIFHDAAAEVVNASRKDVSLLLAEEYGVKKLRGNWDGEASFRTARIERDGKSVEIDRVTDVVFRFFPVVADEVMGFRLDGFDAAVNKALAVASRTVTRDYLDIVEIGRRISLAAICWAACGKDQGHSPVLLFDLMKRFARARPEEVEEIKAREINLIELKKEWVEMADRAGREIEALANEQPEIPIGVAFVDGNGTPCWIRDVPDVKIHSISVRGCLPVPSSSPE